MLKLAAILECSSPAEAISRIAATALAAREKRAEMSSLDGIRDMASNALGKVGVAGDVWGKAQGMAGDVWANPHVRKGLIGAGIGAVANPLLGAVTRRKKKRSILTEALEGAALGGAAGGGGSLLQSRISALSGPPTVEKIAMPEFLSNFGKKIGEGVASAVNPLKGMWENPHVRTGLMGAGLGVGAGALSSLLSRKKRKNTLSSMLTGGLLGGAVGAGGSMVFNRGQQAKSAPADKQEAAGKAQTGYNQLGRLGYDTSKVQDVAGQLRRGELDESQAREQIQAGRPSRGEQFHNAGSSAGEAVRAGHPVEAAKHLDVPGLKNIVPGLGHFDTGTAVAAVGANAAARDLVNPEGKLRKWWNKVTGGIGNAIRGPDTIGNPAPGPAPGPALGPAPAAPKGLLGKGWNKVRSGVGSVLGGARSGVGSMLGTVRSTAQDYLHAKDYKNITDELQRNDFKPKSFSSDKTQQKLLELAQTKATVQPASGVENPVAHATSPTFRWQPNPLLKPGSPGSGDLVGPSKPGIPAKQTAPPAAFAPQTAPKIKAQEPDHISRSELRRWAERQRQGRATEKYTESMKGRGRIGKLTGGWIPSFATAVPLLLREWGGSGFRSGAEPAQDILAANKILDKE